MLIGRHEAIARVQKLKAFPAMYWQAQLRIQAAAHQLQMAVLGRPTPMELRLRIDPPAPAVESCELPLHPLLSKSLFHDVEEDPSFDEWMETIDFTS
jgi:hypothetical protein